MIKRISCYIMLGALLLSISCSDDESSSAPVVPILGNRITETITNGSGLSLFTTPVATFNAAIGQTVTVNDKTFKAVVDEVHLYKDATEIAGQFTLASDAKSGTFSADELLPAESTLRLEVTAHWETETNGTWSTVADQGQQAQQKREQTFSTGTYAPPAEIILAQLPENNSEQQSVVTYPLVIFKESFDAPITLTQGGASYRAIVDEATVLLGTEKIAVTEQWSTTRDSLLLQPAAILQGQTTYSIQVKSHWEVQRNAAWVPVKQGGEVLYSINTTTFKTGTLGDVTQLLPENIAYAYPVELQYYFLQDEYSKGYLMLRTELQNSLVKIAGGERLEARFTSPGKTEIKTPIAFDESTRTLSYDMPTLENQTIYTVRYVKVLVGGNEKEMYRTSFRTSRYNTFLQKMNAFTNAKAYSWMVANGVDEIKSRFTNNDESFDDAEIKTNTLPHSSTAVLHYGVGLIQFEAQPGNKLYDEAYDVMYKGLATGGLNLRWRQVEPVGAPPKYAIYMLQGTANPITNAITSLKQSEIEQNSVTFPTPVSVLIYNLNQMIMIDFIDLNVQAINHPDRETNPYIKALAESTMGIRAYFQDYKVKLKYRLPGKKIVTSEKEITLDYNY
jgi:hypothetical protein